MKGDLRSTNSCSTSAFMNKQRFSGRLSKIGFKALPDPLKFVSRYSRLPHFSVVTVLLPEHEPLHQIMRDHHHSMRLMKASKIVCDYVISEANFNFCQSSRYTESPETRKYGFRKILTFHTDTLAQRSPSRVRDMKPEISQNPQKTAS